MIKTSRFPVPRLWYAAAGFAAGILNGLLGAAGGILLVAVLPYLPPIASDASSRMFDSLSDRRDVLATVLCVMLPTSAVSFALYLFRGIRPPTSTLLNLILPAALGGLLGAFLLDKIPRAALKRIFALVVVISGLRMLLG